jgi:hypothetical protein
MDASDQVRGHQGGIKRRVGLHPSFRKPRSGYPESSDTDRFWIPVSRLRLAPE